MTVAVAANLAAAVMLLAAGVRLIVWGLSGEPGRRRPCAPDCLVCRLDRAPTGPVDPVDLDRTKETS